MTSSDWTTPGAYEVAAGVYRIPLPLPNDGLRTVNVYAVTGDDGVVIVDSGWAIAGGRDALVAGLGGIGLALGDIARFLVTHVHRDHYTLGIRLRQEFDLAVSLGQDEAPTLEVAMRDGSNDMEPQLRHMRSLGAFALAAELAAEAQFPHPDVWELPDDWLQPDDVIAANGRALEVIPTPGHTHGHVVFHDAADALLFAGDHVLPTITPSIGFEPILSPNPLGDYLGSLATVRGLPDAQLLPAHGPVSPSVHKRVDELLEHHSVRLVHSAAALRAGATTAPEVAAVLRWTRQERTLAELNPFNQMLAIAETHAHLLLLEARGEAIETFEDGVWHYQPR